MSQCSLSLTFAIPIKGIRFNHLTSQYPRFVIKIFSSFPLHHTPMLTVSLNIYQFCLILSGQLPLTSDILCSHLIDVLTSTLTIIHSPRITTINSLLSQSFTTLWIYCTLQILWFFTNRKIVTILHWPNLLVSLGQQYLLTLYLCVTIW